MRDGEPGWFYVGNGQLRYKDSNGWTDKFQDIDAVSATQPINSQSSGPTDTAVSPNMKKPHRKRSTLTTALCTGLLVLGVGAGLLNPGIVHGWVSWATGQVGTVSNLMTPSTPPVPTTSEDASAISTAEKAAATKAATAHAKAVAHANAVAHAKAVAEQARQAKAAQAAAAAKAAADAAMAAAVRESVNEPPNRPIPTAGYQCRPGDEKLFEVCASHKAWVDGQVESANCMKSGRTWDIAAQKCR
jgi:cytoskeletal protein RodZ